MARREKGQPRILFYADWLTQNHLVLLVVGLQLLLSSGNLFILLQTTEHWEPDLNLNPILIHLGNPCKLCVLGFLGISNAQLFHAGYTTFSISLSYGRRLDSQCPALPRDHATSFIFGLFGSRWEVGQPMSQH